MSRYLLTVDADGHPSRMKYVDDASGPPTVDDDAATLGVTVGSLWLDTANHRAWVCEDASAAAAVWTELTGAGGGSVPTDADYLVGTASGELSNEIVVGTTPGGELGGTWVAPTVDPTHAGSSHADAQAAAEATADAGLSAHAGDADAHHAWPLTEPDIPASIARDTEVASAVAAHAGDDDAHHTHYTDAEADARAAAAVAAHETTPDPHPAYLTAMEGDAAYEPLGEVATHAADPDAHHAWPLTDGDIPAAIARDTDVGAAIATHAGTADAHHTRYTDAEAIAAVGPHYAPNWGEVTDIADETFGATAAAGALDEEARADHRHAMPADPVPAHAADPDAHHTWPLTEPDIPAAIARDSEVTATIGSHAGTADAHHARYTDAEADIRAAAAVSAHESAADPHTGYVQEAAAPGGELGGTYATPTVDTVHAGSSHAATQAAAEATAAGALASHAGDADAHHDEDHAARHTAGGADPLKLDDLAAPDDTTDLDASTGAHGLLPKLSGSTSQYLRGDGAWATPAGSVSPQAPVVHVYTASTTWTKPTAATFSHIVVECVGGGGGGGGPSATGTNQASQSGGGGGGGYVRKLFGASVLTGSTYTVTVGSGGNGRGAGNTGDDGTASSFSGPGIASAPTASGGGGGGGMNAGTSSSSTGGGGAGSAANGDIDVPGMAGGNGVRISLPGVSSAVAAGNAWGGGSVLGTPQRQSNVGSAGYSGADYGVGGSGAGINQSSTTVAGGDGSDGVVIVTEYYTG